MSASDEPAPKQLSFRNDHPFAIDESNVIGVQDARGDDQDEPYNLLYVTEGENKEEKAEQKTTFNVVPIFAPTDEVLYALLHRPDTSFFPAPAAEHSQSRSPSLHVIISTGSGGQHAQTCFSRLLHPFLATLSLREDRDYTVHATTSTSTITELTASVFLPAARAGTPQSIILLSGDGGVLDIVNGLLSPSLSSSTASQSPESYIPPTIALIPTGTGNALANSTGTTLDHTLGLSTLFRGRPRALPLFRVRLSPDSVLLDSYSNPVAPTSPALNNLADAGVGAEQEMCVYGAVVFSYGLHACLVGDSDTPAYREHGAKRFGMAANDLMFSADGARPHEFRGKVSVRRRGGDWAAIPRETHAYVLATLVSQLEKGFTISPASQPLDGVLRLVHFGPLQGGGEEVMGVMQKAFAGGKHVEDERVGYEEVDGVRVEFRGGEGKEVEEERWRRVCVDGKIFRVGRTGWVSVEMEERRPVQVMWLER